MVGVAAPGRSGAAGEAAGPVAESDEVFDPPWWPVGLDTVLGDHGGAGVKQDPGDAGVEGVGDAGDGVGGDDPDAGHLDPGDADLLPGGFGGDVQVPGGGVDQRPAAADSQPRGKSCGPANYLLGTDPPDGSLNTSVLTILELFYTPR